MKTSYLKIAQSLLVGLLLVGNLVAAQVGIGTTDPDASAMLDITSTTKGVLVPRLTEVQRTGISNPAEGLMVFDTTSQSFWFYSGGWVQLVSGKSLLDADGNTGIEVEQTADENIVHVKTAGAERMTIDETGKTRIGDGTNNTFIESDGSLSYEGSATRYDDLKVPVSTTNKDGSKPPEYYWFQDSSGGGGWGSQGVFAAWFDNSTEEEVYFMVQMPHGWKEGSDIYPHVHWSAKQSLGTKKVQWGLEFTWVNVGDVAGATTMITGNTIIAACDGTAYEHMITTLPTMSGSGKTLSSMIICRLYRDADAGADDFSYDAGLFEIDFHYQIDSDGSREQFTK